VISGIEAEGLSRTPLSRKSHSPVPGALIFSLPPAEPKAEATVKLAESVSREPASAKIPPQKDSKADAGESAESTDQHAGSIAHVSQQEPVAERPAVLDAKTEEGSRQSQRQHGEMAVRESVTQAREAIAENTRLQEKSLSDTVVIVSEEESLKESSEDQGQTLRKWLKGEWQKVRRQPLPAQQSLMLPGGNQRSLFLRPGISFGMKAFAQHQAAAQGIEQRRAPRSNHHGIALQGFRLGAESTARIALSPLASTVHQPDSLSKEWMTLLERVQARVELLKAQQGGQQQLELESPLTGRLQLKLEAGELGWRLSIGVEREVVLQELQKRSSELLSALQESGVLLEELNIDPEDARDQARHQESGRSDESQDDASDQGRFAAELNARLLFRGVRS
jgi:hypothetical protein